MYSPLSIDVSHRGAIFGSQHEQPSDVWQAPDRLTALPMPQPLHKKDTLVFAG